jgi:hypothetical protein
LSKFSPFCLLSPLNFNFKPISKYELKPIRSPIFSLFGSKIFLRHFPIPLPARIRSVQTACGLVAILATGGASVEDLVVGALELNRLVVQASPVAATVEGIGMETEEFVLAGGDVHITSNIVANDALVQTGVEKFIVFAVEDHTVAGQAGDILTTIVGVGHHLEVDAIAHAVELGGHMLVHEEQNKEG